MATATAPRHTRHAVDEHGPPPGVKAGAIVIGMTLLLAVLFTAFALPAAKSRPNELPIGVVGPPAVTDQISTRLEQNSPGGFAVTGYADAAELRSAIRNRDVYGGVVAGPESTLMIATGASPMVAQILTQIGTGMAQQSGRAPVVEDLAAPPSDDPRGAGLAAAALPLTLAGLLPAYVFVLAFRRQVWLRFAATIVFAGLAAVTIAVLLRYLLGTIEANFWGVTGGLTLGVLAMGLAVLGLGSVFGKAGLGIGALLALLLGNPLSGLTSAPELLPNGWGALGQLLPQGANATLLRSTAYFSGAGAGPAIVVLTCWAAAGVALVVVAALRQRRTAST